MKRFAAGFALAAALLGSTLAGTALGQDYNSQRDRQDYNAPPDNSPPQGQGETWRNDRNPGDSRNDGRDQGWGRNRGNKTAFEGQWVADDRAADSRYDRGDFRGGGMRSAQLPSFIRIDQRPGIFRITDRRNRVLQHITIGGRFDPRDNGRDENLVGRWRGQTLVVERAGFRGATITQTFSLENRGRTLVVRTRRDPVGRGPTTEVSTTFHRA
jgi:hypothetical protein